MNDYRYNPRTEEGARLPKIEEVRDRTKFTLIKKNGDKDFYEAINGKWVKTGTSDFLDSKSNQTIEGEKTFGTINVTTANITTLVNNNLVYPRITIGGDDTSRTITVGVYTFGDVTISKEAVITWWLSDSEYGIPGSAYTFGTLSLNQGSNLDPVSASTPTKTGLNHSITASYQLIIQLLEGVSGGTQRTLYFHAEVQGIVYSQSFTINDNTVA